jgi:hypothetical protein
MTGRSEPVAMGFNVHYSESEDRIALQIPTEGQEAVVWLTRRMTGGLLLALATLLARSSPNALLAPEHAAEILGFEHQSALVVASGGQELRLQASRLPKRLPLRLVEHIELTALSNGRSRVALRVGEHRLGLELPRENLHLLYDQVMGLAKHAQWNLDVGEPWPEAAATGESPPRVTH